MTLIRRMVRLSNQYGAIFLCFLLNNLPSRALPAGCEP